MDSSSILGVDDLTKLFLDCEYNGLGGELISMALVTDNGDEFYEVVNLPDRVDTWVAENVIPILAKAPVGHGVFTARLRVFLAANVAKEYSFRKTPPLEIYADWPADFTHLCRALDTMGADDGFVLPFNVRMNLLRVPGVVSKMPHNALEDARALAEAFSNHQGKQC